MVPLIFGILAKMDTFNDTTRLKVNIYIKLTVRIGSGFNQISGSGSRRAKMTHKRRKNTKFYALSLKCWMFSLRTEGFCCSLDVPYWRPRDK
jgi:hypothetical protein